MRKSLLAATVATCLSSLLVAPGAATAAAAPKATAAPKASVAPAVTALPFGTPADVVATGTRVFVSGGPGSTQVAVTTAAGAVTRTLDGLSGPADLQLSNDRRTLYVAEPAAGRISAFSTLTLRRTATYSTGAGSCPASLAFTGQFLWFGYGCADFEGDIGRIDLTSRPAVVTTGLAGYDFYEAPLLASATRNTGVLLASQPGLSYGADLSYRVGTDGSLTRVSITPFDIAGENKRDNALDPTGTTAYTADGYPYYVQSFPAADLSRPGTRFPTGPYPVAVEISESGRVAGGADAAYEPDVFVFTPGGTLLQQFDLGDQYATLVPHGLAWSPAGTTLYAITADGFLHVLPVA
ncbi:YncE family protein [Actinoplanes sp. N902-109]|uniref:YncE family protein n=1 Tax=Actinoplanes sp. (strain N902-109) TaxID=649831 RepID=UPI0003294B69|nr:hypothetical protein [Actinoplanes sp. N902-109]AGL17650.1 hypothetical protein L083_4140 [Actinoplanes sp. N902-109]